MSKKKGDRRERRVKEIFEEAGFEVETPNYYRYGNKDFFNLFDLMAMKKNKKPVFVQVKSNTASGINEFIDKCSDFIPYDFVDIEYWVYHKREGWRVLMISDEVYETVYDGRKNSKNMGEGAIKFLENKY